MSGFLLFFLDICYIIENEEIYKLFKLGDTVNKQKALSLNSLVLAFVGDAVYNLYVKEKIALSCDFKVGEQNNLAKNEVNATAQAEFFKEILPLLTEEELAIYKRARNSHKKTKAKSATTADYHSSTGLEAIFGFLFITGDIDRLNFLFNKGDTN